MVILCHSVWPPGSVSLSALCAHKLRETHLHTYNVTVNITNIAPPPPANQSDLWHHPPPPPPPPQQTPTSEPGKSYLVITVVMWPAMLAVVSSY